MTLSPNGQKGKKAPCTRDYCLIWMACCWTPRNYPMGYGAGISAPMQTSIFQDRHMDRSADVRRRNLTAFCRITFRGMLIPYKKDPRKKAIVSSNGGAWMSSYVELFHFNDVFDAILRGEMAQNRKPDPELYQLACKKLELLPEQSITVEDSASGIAAARAAGVDVIWLKGISNVPEELAAQCVLHAATLDQVITYLRTH